MKTKEANYTVTQDDVDAVANFVEAARELKCSPLFIEEYSRLGIRCTEGSEQKEMQGLFNDPTHIEAMLIPFRRIWQQSNPSHYKRVVNIIKRKNRMADGFIDSLVFNDSGNKDPLKQSEIIDIWLNTRYMHVGGKGKFSRQDFDRYEKMIGKDVFKFHFLVAVHQAGVSFLNILMFAESFLRECDKEGLKPSFEFPKSLAGDNEDHTPGYPVPADTPEHRVWRLRHRRRYEGLSKFFDLLSYSDEVLSKYIAQAISFDEFVTGLKVRMRKIKELAIGKNITRGAGAIDYPHLYRPNQKPRRGLVAKRKDGSIMWTEDYVPILQDEYLEFRKALLAQPFR
jgi:hypothetical protein